MDNFYVGVRSYKDASCLYNAHFYLKVAYSVSTDVINSTRIPVFVVDFVGFMTERVVQSVAEKCPTMRNFERVYE